MEPEKIHILKEQSSGLKEALIDGVEHYVAPKEKYNAPRSKAQAKAFKEKQRRNKAKKDSIKNYWVACFHDPIKQVIEEDKLTLEQLGLLMKLVPRLWFNTDNKLIEDNKPLRKKDIARIAKISVKQAERHLNALCKHGLMHKEREGRGHVYYISEKFHKIAGMDNKLGDNFGFKKAFTKVYKKSQPIIDKLKLQEAGLLWKITPYFHYSKYYLSKNPNEVECPELYYFTHTELAEELGMSPWNLTLLMKGLLKNFILKANKTGTTVHYIVNPDILFRQEKEDGYTEAIREQFKAHKVSTMRTLKDELDY